MNDSEQKLVRAIGLKEIIALTINGVIGAGIFALPADAARILGPVSPFAFVMAGIFAANIVLCFAELGSRFDRTGGAYLYAHEAFGGLIGFLIGWIYFLARLTSTAALTIALAGFVNYFIPLEAYARVAFLVLLLLTLGLINYRGIRFSTRLIDFLTLAKLLPLMLFIIAGLFFVDWQRFAHLPMPEVRPLTQTLLLAMFAFSGFEVIAVPGGEIVDARRTLPLGLLVGTGITILIYVLVQTVAVGTFPGLANSQTPLSSAARLFLGTKGGAILGVGAICSTIGTLTSLLLVAPRILFAMALNFQMPPSFSRIHPRYRTPHVAILFCTLLTIAVTLFGSFTRLATLSAIARIITYIGSAIALLILRKKTTNPEKFRIPGGPVVPLFTILLCLFLLTAATLAHWIAGGVAIAVGLLLYAWSLKRMGRHAVSN